MDPAAVRRLKAEVAMRTYTPKGHRPDRYFVWLRYMKIHRKCYVSSRSQFNKLS